MWKGLVVWLALSVNCEIPTHVWFFYKMCTVYWMTLHEESLLKHFIITRRHIPYFYLPILGTQKSKSPLTKWLLDTGDTNDTGLIRLVSCLLMSHSLFFIWSWTASVSICIPNSKVGLFPVTVVMDNFMCQLGQLLGQTLIYMLLWRLFCRSDWILPSKM